MQIIPVCDRGRHARLLKSIPRFAGTAKGSWTCPSQSKKGWWGKGQTSSKYEGKKKLIISAGNPIGQIIQKSVLRNGFRKQTWWAWCDVLLQGVFRAFGTSRAKLVRIWEGLRRRSYLVRFQRAWLMLNDLLVIPLVLGKNQSCSFLIWPWRRRFVIRLHLAVGLVLPACIWWDYQNCETFSSSLSKLNLSGLSRKNQYSHKPIVCYLIGTYKQSIISMYFVGKTHLFKTNASHGLVSRYYRNYSTKFVWIWQKSLEEAIQCLDKAPNLHTNLATYIQFEQHSEYQKSVNLPRSRVAPRLFAVVVKLDHPRPTITLTRESMAEF